MKNKTSFLKLLMLALILLLFSNYNVAQEANNDCRVLLSSISKQYNGDCKKGLAHGKGVAVGIDKYEGNFKLGLPHGSGKYSWKNGDIYTGRWKNGKRNGIGILLSASNGVSTKGQWKEDNFIKEIKDPAYKVTYKKGISRSSFEKLSESGSEIEVVISRDGRVNRNLQSLQLITVNGNSYGTSSYIGFENVTYPFEGTIKFLAPGLLTEVLSEVEFRFKITEEGKWRIRLSY